MDRRSVSGAAKLTLLLLLGAAIIIAGTHPEVRGMLNRDRLLDVMREAGPLAPILHMSAMATAIVVSPIPTVPLDVVGGLLFGPYLGTLYSSLGALFGAVIAFMIARRIGRNGLESLLNQEICICPECSNRALTILVFVSRLLPVVSFDFISYGAGLTRLPLRAFAFATYFGMLPLTYVYTIFGAHLLSDPLIASVAGAILAVAFLALPWVVRKYNPLGLRRYFFAQKGE